MMKFRFFYDKDAETEWLNQMAADGYAMTVFFAGFYKFETCRPGEYVYQIDFGNSFFKINKDYREFMQDTGVEVLQAWGPWVFLRKPASEGRFELYTDVDSGIEHYSKIRKMFKILTIIELICFFMELFAALEGNTWAYVCLFLIGALLIVFVNTVFKINQVIAGLQERKGEQPSVNTGRKVSLLLPCGLLLNSCALLVEETVWPTARHVIQIAAIVCMLAGIYRTARLRDR